MLFHVKEHSFSYESFCTWPRFENEAKSNLKMGYCLETETRSKLRKRTPREAEKVSVTGAGHLWE